MAPPAEAARTLPHGVATPAWDSVADYVRRDAPRAAGWLLPFILTVYLGLKGGGYDLLVRNEVGVVLWWIVLLGVVVGALPAFRLGRPGWIGLGLLTAFAAWTTIGISWSASAERSMVEASRVAVYLGVFVLALSIRRPGSLRRTVNGLAAGIVVIALFALLSRLHPSWFPTDDDAQFLQTTRQRLSYPLNYWNDLAALMAMGIPLLLTVAIQARTTIASALSAAMIPVLALTAFFTLSRGGAIEAGVGLAAFVLLAPRRLAALPTITLAAAGGAILVAAATQRNDLADGLVTSAASHQANEMLAITVVVCGGVALLQVAVALAGRHGIGPRLTVPRRIALPLAGTLAVITVAVALGAGLPGTLSDQWREFKQPAGAGTSVSRFESSSGSGRYQTWDAAIKASETDTLTGIGPGTFEYWWAQNGSIPVFVRDAHSLYVETLGELGIIGLMLIGGFVVTVLSVGASRSLRGPPERRWAYAAATASAAVFAVAAGIDWAWELTVVPVAFLVLAGSLLSPRRYRSEPTRSRGGSRGRRRSRSERRPGLPYVRIGIGALSVVAIVLIVMPLRGVEALRSSENDARSGDLTGALEQARTAHDRQPYAASPLVQEALVLELMGHFGAGIEPARQATKAESTNWRTWLVLSRLEAESGDAQGAIAAYRQARSLNPRSPLFAQR